MTGGDGVSLLIGSMLALLVGPVLYRSSRSLDQARSLLDGFIFVAIAGLLGLHILPELLAQGGVASLLLLTAGLLGPTLLERLSRFSRAAHSFTLYLALAGLCVHAVADGAALVGGSEGGSGPLAIAVILHRLPIGLGIWWLMRPTSSLMRAAVLAVVCAATVAGFFGGSFLVRGVAGGSLIWFQAFVAGSLLHVVLHRPGEKWRQSGRAGWFEGAGGLLGLLLLVVLSASEGISYYSDGFSSVGSTFWTLALQSAPALMVGYLLAGLASTFLPVSSIRWLKRGSPLGQSAKGMVAGLPVPICSCGVVPLYRTLILRGTPLPAATAFLVATPELGLDAVLLSIPLLGVPMTVLRVTGAALVALTIGWLMGFFSHSRPLLETEASQSEEERPPSFGVKMREGLRIGLIEVVDHTAPWILFGLLVAALTEPLLAGGWMASVPGPVGVLAFALLGLPAYVCASGATPLVAVLLLNGLSPGAALAFLLTGPATNVTTFGVLAALHGKRMAMFFSASMIGCAVAVGCLANLVMPVSRIAVPESSPHSTPLQVVCLLLLGALVLFSILRRGARQFAGEILGSAFADAHSHSH